MNVSNTNITLTTLRQLSKCKMTDPTTDKTNDTNKGTPNNTTNPTTAMLGSLLYFCSNSKSNVFFPPWSSGGSFGFEV